MAEGNAESLENGVPAFELGNTNTSELQPLLEKTIEAVTEAAQALMSQYSRDARISTMRDLLSNIKAKDQISAPILKRVLQKARPDAKWDEDELDSGGLSQGAWWVTDPVEGNINYIHGITDWCTTATLVVDEKVLLTAVCDPIHRTTYSALLGGGAYQDGARLKVSSKTGLKAALVGTGQAKPGEDDETHKELAESVAAMLRSALVLQVSVPATLQMMQVAAGRRDLFWQAS